MASWRSGWFTPWCPVWHGNALVLLLWHTKRKWVSLVRKKVPWYWSSLHLFSLSLPAYDTMTRFPRASAPPRHGDWWHQGGTFVFFSSQYSTKVQDKSDELFIFPYVCLGFTYFNVLHKWHQGSHMCVHLNMLSCLEQHLVTKKTKKCVKYPV